MTTRNAPDAAAEGTPVSTDTPVGDPGGTRGEDGPHHVRTTPGEPAFDALRPPSKELLSDCVHCGFCLPTCPTYALWGEEMDSPRGRIYLMSAGLAGEPLTDTMAGHFDACLGCMACVSACPSGVQYDKLIDATRAQVERRHRRSLPDRALREGIFALFTRPDRLRKLRAPLNVYHRTGLAGPLRRSGVLERIAPQVAAMEAAAPVVTEREEVPEHTPAVGARRGTVAMILGCVQREFFPGVNSATARVLAAEGYDVLAPRSQGCCGALSVHNGRDEEGREYARRLIDTLSPEALGTTLDHVVINAAGCGSTLKEYGELLADDPAYARRAEEFAARVVDISEILTMIEPVAPRHELKLTIAYHDACHLAHAQGIRRQPRDLLAAIPGVTLREIGEPDLCCGSAGIYSIVNPVPARELGDRKAANVAATGADLLVTANPGCMMQIAAGLTRAGAPMAVTHTAIVLDAAIRGAAPESLLSPVPITPPRKRHR